MDGASGGWLAVAEAAKRLGTGERNMRRRIVTGRYPTRQAAGRMEVYILEAPEVLEVAPERIPEQPEAPSGSAGTPPDVAAIITAATEPLERALHAERERASQAEQAAAMWQERARGLEAETQRLQTQLALPAPQPEPRAPWWAFLRWGRQP